MLLVYLQLMTQPCYLMLYYNKFLFIRVFSPFSSMIHKLRFHIHNSIIDPSFLIPEPTLTSEDNIFVGWFGIKFQISLHTTDITLLLRQRFCMYITHHRLSLYTLPLYRQLRTLISSRN